MSVNAKNGSFSLVMVEYTLLNKVVFRVFEITDENGVVGLKHLYYDAMMHTAFQAKMLSETAILTYPIIAAEILPKHSVLTRFLTSTQSSRLLVHRLSAC